MKNDVKFDGNLGLYLNFPLYLGVFLAAINISLYIYNVRSGLAVTTFLFIYMGFAVLLYTKAKKEFTNEIICFATQYSTVQKKLL